MNYTNVNTELVYKNNGVKIPVTFAKEAKKEIYDRYNYPKCIDYLLAFERAMTRSANNTGASGLKHLGSNSENVTGFEVKIAMDKYRIYSSEDNPYYFDKYDFYGLHD